MKNKFFLCFIIFFFIFCFIVLFKGLKNPKTYIPDTTFGNSFSKFVSNDLFSGKEIYSEELFKNDKVYVLNIWASWCLPCREEHPKLMKLKENSKLEVIGLNYKDDVNNAKNFINKFGNPYSKIITDKDGTISISMGAYGVPETFIIGKNKMILKKFIGPLNNQSLNQIELLLK
ncbi:DsbE family thiol:disulfide interchange protein [Candidatus Pelagibacter sp.]|nr:DsbE family thiol:disulfide interchange protein [Candidatus Pelagibacter sp.]|tara:strand:+ start:1683 stop:2204 length:522 start_codon:yes stop_codon:yes gene_type:complete